MAHFTTILMSDKVAYPIPLPGNNVLVSAAAPIQIATEEHYLDLTGSAVPSMALFLAGFSAGQGNNTIELDWKWETMWITQTSGSPFMVSIYCW